MRYSPLLDIDSIPEELEIAEQFVRAKNATEASALLERTIAGKFGEQDVAGAIACAFAGSGEAEECLKKMHSRPAEEKWALWELALGYAKRLAHSGIALAVYSLISFAVEEGEFDRARAVLDWLYSETPELIRKSSPEEIFLWLKFPPIPPTRWREFWHLMFTYAVEKPAEVGAEPGYTLLGDLLEWALSEGWTEEIDTAWRLLRKANRFLTIARALGGVLVYVRKFHEKPEAYRKLWWYRLRNTCLPYMNFWWWDGGLSYLIEATIVNGWREEFDQVFTFARQHKFLKLLESVATSLWGKDKSKWLRSALDRLPVDFRENVWESFFEAMVRRGHKSGHHEGLEAMLEELGLTISWWKRVVNRHEWLLRVSLRRDFWDSLLGERRREAVKHPEQFSPREYAGLFILFVEGGKRNVLRAVKLWSELPEEYRKAVRELYDEIKQSADPFQRLKYMDKFWSALGGGSDYASA